MTLLRVVTYNIHKGVQGIGPRRRLEIHNLAQAVAQGLVHGAAGLFLAGRARFADLQQQVLGGQRGVGEHHADQGGTIAVERAGAQGLGLQRRVAKGRVRAQLLELGEGFHRVDEVGHGRAPQT